MNGFLASLRLPVALRGRWTLAAAVPANAAPVGMVGAADRTSEPFRTMVRATPAPHVHGTLSASPLTRPVAAVEPTLDATAPLPSMPLEPSVRVASAHLVDPVGLRVVPFRPTSRWPLRRAAPRIYDPFRGFPQRSAHLADLMDGRTR